MNTIYDNISGDDSQVYITSGSFGEGLDMRGSDTDVMIVSKHNEIYDTLTPFVFNPTKTYFSLMTEDTKPGFAMLRLIYSSPNSAILQYCEHFRRDNYLSNALLKSFFLKDNSYFELHGPCISDKGGLTDLAPCLHCKSWVTPAFRWTMRSNNSWPNGDIK
ncbi:unnamed protein product [Mytilus coruscus]|uniref:Uncharacterized protein n=1 Tax=Mytilus coruscus TaxID=42192 RepID=A0A6J8AAK4_MYTCO|nr:unnamed protein product [Mytilus coruscus]